MHLAVFDKELESNKDPDDTYVGRSVHKWWQAKLGDLPAKPKNHPKDRVENSLIRWRAVGPLARDA